MGIATARKHPERTYPMVSDKLHQELFPWLEGQPKELVMAKMTGVINGWPNEDLMVDGRLVFVSDKTVISTLQNLDLDIREVCEVVANECLTLLRDEAAKGTSIEALACQCGAPANPIDGCTYHRMVYYVELLVKGLTTE